MEPLRAVDLLVLRTVAELHTEAPAHVDVISDEADVDLATVLLSVRILSQHRLVQVIPPGSDETDAMTVRLTDVAIRALDAPIDPSS